MLATLLPDPDSPTMPSISPRLTSSERPSTALTTPSSVSKWTLRSSICRSAGVAHQYLTRGSR